MNPMKPSALVSTLAAFATLSFPAHAAPPELRETARRLSAAHRDSVVWISVISRTNLSVDGDAAPEIKAALASQDKESKHEVTGTVIDPAGLIVTALSGLDKSSMVDGKSIPTPAGEIKIKASAEIKTVTIIAADGSERPADLVLKDDDLGLAFIRVRPATPLQSYPALQAVSLADSASAEVLDDAITLGRLDNSLDRAPCTLTSEIIGKVTNPRTFYRIQNDSVGCPIFLGSGKLLGISILRPQQIALDPSGQLNASPVVLPAADIARAAAQIPPAQAPAKTEN
jgi:hypothetical protein